jgi:hypothetical protein
MYKETVPFKFEILTLCLSGDAEENIDKDYTKPCHQVSWRTNFGSVEPNIRGFSVRNIFHVTQMVAVMR